MQQENTNDIKVGSLKFFAFAPCIDKSESRIFAS